VVIRIFIVLVVITIFFGCVPTLQIANNSIPQLLVQEPLPALPETMKNRPSKISMALFVAEDGSVTKVRLIKGIDNPSWDSLAVSTMMRWKFKPARLNETPVGTWFHMQSPIRYKEPLYITLAEIVCSTREEIDLVYTALIEEQDYYELAARYSIDSSHENNGVLGEVNIMGYPETVRHILSGLEIGEFTKPLQYGDRYVIFKRLKK
jgi:TonB family protein